jgi:hypothetical protein
MKKLDVPTGGETMNRSIHTASILLFTIALVAGCSRGGSGGGSESTGAQTEVPAAPAPASAPAAESAPAPAAPATAGESGIAQWQSLEQAVSYPSGEPSG